MSNVQRALPPCTGTEPGQHPPVDTLRNIHCTTCGAFKIDGVLREAPRTEAPSAPRVRVVNWNALQDRCEAVDRARVVRSILERCEHELAALEAIPHLSADDVNELGASKGFVGRAILALGRMGL